MLKFFIFYFLFYSCTCFSYVNKIAVLDLNSVLKNSYEYKNSVYSLNNKINFKKKYFNKNISILRKKEIFLNKYVKYFTMDKYNFLIKKLYIDKKNIEKEINNFNDYVNRKNIIINNNILNKILKIIKDISIKNNYSFVLDSNYFFYYNKSIIDITKFVVIMLNNI